MHHAGRVGPDQPDPGLPRDGGGARLTGGALRPGLGEAVRQHRHHPHPGRRAVGQSLKRRIGVKQDVGVVHRPGLRHRFGCRQPLHRVAARIDRHDLTLEAMRGEKGLRSRRQPPGRVGGPDQRDAAGRDQGVEVAHAGVFLWAFLGYHTVWQGKGKRVAQRYMGQTGACRSFGPHGMPYSRLHRGHLSLASRCRRRPTCSSP